MKSKLVDVSVCLYVCVYVVITLLVLPGSLGQALLGFPPTPLFEWSQSFCPYTGHTTYSMGTETNKNDKQATIYRFLSFPSMVTKNRLIKGCKEEAVELGGGEGVLDLILGSGMGNYIFRLLGGGIIYFLLPLQSMSVEFTQHQYSLKYKVSLVQFM